MTGHALPAGTPTRRRGAAGREALWAALVLSGCLAAGSCSTKGSDPAVSWAEHDDTNPEAVDHADWQAILDGYLRTDDPSGIHLFDYGGLQAHPADRERLRGYLAHLESVDPRRYSRNEQMAYWLNFYNALTVETVVEAYPVNSIRSIHEGPIPLSGPWGDERATVAGARLTLDNIEHDILRALWRDPRIHYAANCASLGCPNLPPTAFRAANLEELLNAGARDYVNHPRGVELTGESSAVISSIYSWYREDFGGSEAGVVDHLLRHAAPELAERLRDFDGRLDYEYDWSLNDAR